MRCAIKRERQADWDRLKKLALGLGLPGVDETTSYGQPTLKAHGKLWVWWSPHEDAPVFKVPIEEREMLVEVEPETFFFTPHYKDYPLVLVRPEKLDLDWAKANLIKVWRAQAPKRLLKAHDIAAEAKPNATSRTQRAKTPCKASPTRRSRHKRVPVARKSAMSSRERPNPKSRSSSISKSHARTRLFAAASRAYRRARAHSSTGRPELSSGPQPCPVVRIEPS